MSTYTRPITASLQATGLTTGSALGYRVEGLGGTVIRARTTAGITERGTSAEYYAEIANFDTSWSGYIVWDAGAGDLTADPFLADAPQTGDSFARLGTPAGASIAADIATRSTYAGADTGGTVTLLGRIPGVVQPQTGDAYARLGSPAGASVAADIATRLPTTGYTAPDNTSISAIKTKTDLIPSGGPLAASAYTSPPSAITIATQVDTTLSGTHGSGSWLTGSAGGGGSGDGSVRVDHAYGATQGDPMPLAFQTAGGAGIDNAEVRAYLASDYAAGRTGAAFVVARVLTAAGGLWAEPMFLDPGSYLLEYHKQGAYGRATLALTVS